MNVSTTASGLSCLYLMVRKVEYGMICSHLCPIIKHDVHFFLKNTRSKRESLHALTTTKLYLRKWGNFFLNWNSNFLAYLPMFELYELNSIHMIKSILDFGIILRVLIWIPNRIKIIKNEQKQIGKETLWFVMVIPNKK